MRCKKDMPAICVWMLEPFLVTRFQLKSYELGEVDGFDWKDRYVSMVCSVKSVVVLIGTSVSSLCCWSYRMG